MKNRIVYRETPFSGTAAPGDVVLVRLTVAGANDWRYLLIEDPLPAGAETIADDSLYPLEKSRARPWGGTPGVPRRSRGLLPGRPARWTGRVLVPAEDRHAWYVPRDAGPGHADVRARSVGLDDADRHHGRHAGTAGGRPVIRRVAIISAWLLVGSAAWFAIFCGLLHVPESSVWMLALSAVLALALVVVAGAVLAGASAAWDLARPPAHGLRAGVRTVPAALAAALLFGAIWWLTGLLFAWHTGIAGQIDAWVIARTGRPNARWIHFTIFWVTLWVRWSIGLDAGLVAAWRPDNGGRRSAERRRVASLGACARSVARGHLLVRPAGGDSVAPGGLASGQGSVSVWNPGSSAPSSPRLRWRSPWAGLSCCALATEPRRILSHRGTENTESLLLESPTIFSVVCQRPEWTALLCEARYPGALPRAPNSMTLGDTVSHYRILSFLGAGGMGEVYKAEDTRLKRAVALKFLPLALLQDEQAKQRLLIEAQGDLCAGSSEHLHDSRDRRERRRPRVPGHGLLRRRDAQAAYRARAGAG